MQAQKIGGATYPGREVAAVVVFLEAAAADEHPAAVVALRLGLVGPGVDRVDFMPLWSACAAEEADVPRGHEQRRHVPGAEQHERDTREA